MSVMLSYYKCDVFISPYYTRLVIVTQLSLVILEHELLPIDAINSRRSVSVRRRFHDISWHRRTAAMAIIHTYSDT